MSIFIGGTGSANELDDYEEGTWTPTVSEGTVSASGNAYTKIGRLVYLQAYLQNFSNNSSGSNVGVGGLPFTVGNSGQAAGVTMYAYVNNSNRFVVYVDGSNRLFFYGVYSGNYSSLKHNNLNSGANMHISVTYMTST
tara:strand:- start:97 stop:510 length:414 start_codon:yes stop_codon:yes gene_type:complete